MNLEVLKNLQVGDEVHYDWGRSCIDAVVIKEDFFKSSNNKAHIVVRIVNGRSQDIEAINERSPVLLSKGHKRIDLCNNQTVPNLLPRADRALRRASLSVGCGKPLRERKEVQNFATRVIQTSKTWRRIDQKTNDTHPRLREARWPKAEFRQWPGVVYFLVPDRVVWEGEILYALSELGANKLKGDESILAKLLLLFNEEFLGIAALHLRQQFKDFNLAVAARYKLPPILPDNVFDPWSSKLYAIDSALPALGHLNSPGRIKALVDKITTTQLWVCGGSETPTLVYRDMAVNSALASRRGGKNKLIINSRHPIDKMTLIHELAHFVHDKKKYSGTPHGPEFAAIFMQLIEEVEGREVASYCRDIVKSTDIPHLDYRVVLNNALNIPDLNSQTASLEQTAP